ncbi:MAG: GntR family transcriptional regulator [Mycobacteriales bacterium]|jgi:GntR family transcriptional regulator
MFAFRLESWSGVPAYLQLVQQVRQALTLGYLHHGDQLPTVKEVAGDLAVNPNTVVKAYRQLEQEGLVTARQGLGTFVTSSIPAVPPARQAALRRALERWLRDAYAAGLDEQAVNALVATTHRELRARGVA